MESTATPDFQRLKNVVPQAILAPEPTAEDPHMNTAPTKFSIDTYNNGDADYSAICCARSAGELTFASARLAGITIR